LRKILLMLGLLWALIAIGWAAYLAFQEPPALAENAVPLLILTILALSLIIYGQKAK